MVYCLNENYFSIMSETVRKLCTKAKLASRDSTDSREDNLDLQEPAQKKICLDTIKGDSDDNVSNDLSTNQLSAMDDEASDEPVPEAAPSNYMSFLLSLSQNPQNEVPIQAFSPEPLSSEQDEDTSSSESEYILKEDKNYDVNIEKIKEILAVLHELYPDEMEAVIHTRNEWGRILYEKYPSELQFSPQDSQLHDVIAQWRRWSVKAKMERDTPLCFKCYLCNKAWWSLEEFRTHIKQHTSCKLQMETSYRDFNIVAYEGHIARHKELPIDGKCLKCAKTYEYHVESKKLSDKYYSCLYCDKMFDSCRVLSKHAGICDSDPVIAEARKQLTFTDPPCDICGIFLTSSDLSEHFSICHRVRSDEPIFTLSKPCHLCTKTYYVKEFHVCMKRIVSFNCTFCDRKFQTRQFLNSHLKAWDGGVRCRICNKFFMNGCMLGPHYVEHSKNFLMAHQCIVCDYVKLFETAEELTEHRSIQHRSLSENLYKHKIVMAKVMLQQCIDGGELGNILQNYERENEESDSFKEEQTIQEGEICGTESSSESDDDSDTTEDDSEESDTPNISHDHDHVDSKHNTKVPFVDKTIVIKEENDENDPIILNEVAEEHLDSNDKVAVKEVVEEVDKEVVEEVDKEEVEEVNKEVVEEVDKEIVEEVDEEEVEEVNKEVEEEVDTEVVEEVDVEEVDKEEIGPDEDAEIEHLIEDNDIDVKIKEDHENVENSNDIVESDDIADDNSCEKGTESNKVLPKIIGQLNEFLDIKPEKAGVKEENVSDDEDVKILEMETDSISKAPQSTARVFQVTKSLLESESAAVNQAIKEELNDLIVLESSDSDDETLNVIKNSIIEETLNIEPEEIIKAGYRKRKTYRCSKCCFSGYHREYKEHVNSRCKITKSSSKIPKRRSKSKANDVVFRCSKCSSNFPSLRRYVVHFKRHGYDELACPQCKSQFENATALESHVNNHIKNQFVRIRVLTAGEEEEPKRSFKCKDCEQIEGRNDSFTHWERHLKLCHELTEGDTEIVPYTVGIRGKHALKPGALKQVIAKLQEGKLKISTCFVCKRDFPSGRRDDSKRHLIEHLLEDAFANIVDNRLLKCQICSELHKKPDVYKKHMRDHASLPIYQCSMCNKSFSDSSNFIKHKKVHNLENFICDICKKKFQRMDSLEKHIKMHAVTAPLSCEYCSKVFHCPSLHRIHLRMHHKKTLPPRCHLCHETFATKGMKAEHLWAVHKLRRYNADCPICGLAFRTLPKVKKHAKDEHGVNLIRVNRKREEEGEEIKEGDDKEENKDGGESEGSEDCLVVEDDTETLIVLD